MVTLIELACYLKKVQLASLEQIANHFQQKPASIEAMLTILLEQHKVVCKNNLLICGKSCTSCPIAKSAVVYCWNHG